MKKEFQSEVTLNVLLRVFFTTFKLGFRNSKVCFCLCPTLCNSQTKVSTVFFTDSNIGMNLVTGNARLCITWRSLYNFNGMIGR